MKSGDRGKGGRRSCGEQLHALDFAPTRADERWGSRLGHLHRLEYRQRQNEGSHPGSGTGEPQLSLRVTCVFKERNDFTVMPDTDSAQQFQMAPAVVGLQQWRMFVIVVSLENDMNKQATP
eukprot:3493042-Pleurochrysis_carterae.AAC.2